jgi:glycosyltransferase involved in cell wall biosynthesis
MDEQTGKDHGLRISAVITAYNIGEYIGRAIESALNQVRQPDEIIVVDDGSTDETANVIGQYESKVRYIHQENAGSSSARNTGIRNATCEWVAFLDGDDEWLPEHLLLQSELLERNRELVWSTGNYIRCLCDEDRRSEHLPEGKIEEHLRGKDYFDDYLSAFLIGADGNTDTMVVKKEALQEAGMFFTGLQRAEDMDLWLRIAFLHPKAGYVSKAATVYHLGMAGSLSRQFTPSSSYTDLIERLLKKAAEAGREEEFKHCASYLLRGWMRSMLFDARAKDIRSMLDEFDELFGTGYKVLMRILTVFPRVTRAGCFMISRIVRLLRLRKKLVRRRGK